METAPRRERPALTATRSVVDVVPVLIDGSEHAHTEVRDDVAQEDVVSAWVEGYCRPRGDHLELNIPAREPASGVRCLGRPSFDRRQGLRLGLVRGEGVEQRLVRAAGAAVLCHRQFGLLTDLQ